MRTALILLTIIGFIIPTIIANDTICLFSNVTITHPEMYDDFPKLWQLDMSNQTSYEFPADRVLLIHKKLARFYCNNCSVRSIYKQSFSKLPQLTHLELDHNGLSHIHPDAFENNPLLQKVQLVGNGLLRFNAEGTLRHVTYLSLLRLDHNPGFDINQVRVELPWLAYFSCKYCNTSFVDKSTMRRWHRLGHLYLPNNRIERIDPDSFQELVRFKHLNVNGNNKLSRLTVESKTMLHLVAEDCGLEGMLDTSNLPALESINVRNNTITEVNEQGFQKNANIKRILLDGNEIEEIPEKLLALSLYNLEALCIDRNPLQPRERLDGFVLKYNSKRLRRGCLEDDNTAKQFEKNLPSREGIALYTEMKKNLHLNETVADFTSSNVVFIEDDYFEKMNSITNVIMNNNSGYDFPSSTVFLRSESIAIISLEHCAITSIQESTFKYLPSVTSINLKGNQIKSLHSTKLFQNNSKLVHLNLAHNQLEFLIPNLFQDLKSLRSLNLNHNRFLSSERSNPFLITSFLEYLTCRSCGFFQIDSITFAGLTKLTELDLSYNHITSVAEHAFSWTKLLKRLDLSHNRLYTFNPDLKQLNHLQTLCLAGNEEFNFELPKSEKLVDSTPHMVRLEKGCSDSTFSTMLIALYSGRTTTTTEAESSYRSAKMMVVDEGVYSGALIHSIDLNLLVLTLLMVNILWICA